jgi:arylsulfatase A-like enzyme
MSHLDEIESENLIERKSLSQRHEFMADEVDNRRKHRLLYISVVSSAIAIFLIIMNSQHKNVFHLFSSRSHRIIHQIPKTDDQTASSIMPSKPHVIIILADDMGYSSLGTAHDPLSFATPTLTKLATSGIIMSNYYAQEVCTPARAALLTGRLPLSVGMQYFMVQSAIPWGLSMDETTMAEIFLENDYRTHMLGKWHLGHFTPFLLPTARGFESFTGMLNGESYYWSKKNLDHPTFKDLLISNQTCYAPYQESDLHVYSTFLYRDKAISIIQQHDPIEPLFLYLSFQAVHDPFGEIDKVHLEGIPKSFLPDEIYDEIQKSVYGEKRRMYTMSMYLMDEAIGKIIDELKAKGMYENSYIIFSSDNGGCYGGGGMNGPLRGTKGSLFEGGVKVDAFIHSPLLPTSLSGSSYAGLFHISDWLPTLMDLTDVKYEVKAGYEFDGVSHVNSWLHRKAYPRHDILYNYYDNIDFYTFDIWTNGSFAVRDDRYKLLHTFDSKAYGGWYNEADSMDSIDDDINSEIRCAPQIALNDGDFTYYLFDLVNDPYETKNLYNSSDKAIETAKQALYQLAEKYYSRSKEITFEMRGNREAFIVWKDHDDFIVPYAIEKDLDQDKAFPRDCSSYRFKDDDGA